MIDKINSHELKQFPTPLWARSPHVQTILTSILPSPRVVLRRERLELSDGDFIDLDWADVEAKPSRIMVIFHIANTYHTFTFI